MANKRVYKQDGIKDERVTIRLTKGEKAAYEQAVTLFGAGAVIGIMVSVFSTLSKFNAEAVNLDGYTIQVPKN